MGVAQVFVGKIFVHRLQTMKSTKILPPENYPLYGILTVSMVIGACLFYSLHSICHTLTQSSVSVQKFASQNKCLKDKHRMMKRQLAITQKQISTLQLKLRLYQPNFSFEDEPAVTNV